MQVGGGVAEVVGGLAALLLFSTATLAVSKRYRFPSTVGLVVVGVALSQLGRLGPGYLEALHAFELPPAVVFFVLLPALVFESAFNLEGRALRENLAPVLTMAVPGLLVSTGLLGALMHWTTGMEWTMALLLGTVLSATDPAGVTALFRQLGAPKRLSILVEGESLFNDATSIVASRIILGVILAGSVSTAAILSGVGQFVVIFLGGLVVGWGAAVAVGMILGRVEADAFIEISLTLVLAYLSFILAEEALGMSGVMATVASGIMIGGWGKTKISPELQDHLRGFWQYMAGVANALLFLMVGLRVDLGALAASIDLVAVAIVAMVLSRALVVFGLVPLVGRLPRTDPVDRRYQAVMVWGGMRGGIALAIALSLPAFPGREVVIAVTMGAVLFTLLVPGLSMKWLVRKMRLHVPPLSDRLSRAEGLLAAKRKTLRQIPELEEGGLFSPRVAEAMRSRTERDIREAREVLRELRTMELDREEERRLLHLRCFAEEKSSYYRMFEDGHLSEAAYRDLRHSLELQTEKVRHTGNLPPYTLYPPGEERVEFLLVRVLDRIPGLGSAVERIRARRTAKDFEVSWARSRATRDILRSLDEMGREESVPPDVVDEIRDYYQSWHDSARRRMDLTAEQFPEFVSSTQERLAERLAIHAERQAIQERARSGALPDGVAEAILKEMAGELRRIRATQASKLQVSAEELLRKVPFFQDTPEDEFQRVADLLRPRTAPSGQPIIRQAQTGDSLFLVARGVVRVTRTLRGERQDIATLTAGDFFGEMALLHGTPRTASCIAVTPCALYELRRSDLDVVRSACPAIQAALEDADRTRSRELRSRAARKAEAVDST
ncbi:MAG: cation:proton antiporter [Gemmatimonadota bacterium]